MQVALYGNKLGKTFDENIFKCEIEELIKSYDNNLKTSITILYDYL